MWLKWFLLVFMLLLDGSVTAASVPTLSNVITLLRLEHDVVANLERGKIVTFAVQESTRKELAIGLATYLPSSPTKLADFFKQGDFIGIDPDVLAFGEIFPHAGIDTFRHFSFAPKQSDEVQNLLAAEHEEFNLSADEISRFVSLNGKLSDLDRANLIGVVSQRYRHVLWQRWQAYYNQGLSGVVPYTRGNGKVDPGEELRLLADNNELLALLSPALKKAWLSYPSHFPQEAIERFLWLNREVNGRPAAILTHRVLYTADSISMIASRHFFVGHSYNAGQMVLACLPHREGMIVFYIQQTSTDKVTGLGSSLKRSVGRMRIKQQMIKNLERMRAAMQSY